MTIKIAPLKEHQFNLVWHHGEVTTAEMLSWQDQLVAQFDFNYPVIVYMDDDVSYETVTTDDLRHSRQVYPPHAHRIVVTKSKLVFGLNRMFFTYADDQRGTYDIVKSLGDAFNSLGIELNAHLESRLREFFGSDIYDSLDL